MCLILQCNTSLNKQACNFSWHQPEFGNAGVSVRSGCDIYGVLNTQVPAGGQTIRRKRLCNDERVPAKKKKKKGTRLKNAGVPEGGVNPLMLL